MGPPTVIPGGGASMPSAGSDSVHLYDMCIYTMKFLSTVCHIVYKSNNFSNR